MQFDMLKKVVIQSLLYLLAGFYLPAQIVYTDIPDTVLTYPDSLPGLDTALTNHYYFDLDGNEEMDFFFEATTWKEWISPSVGVDSFYVLQLRNIDDQSVAFLDGCAIDFGYGEAVESIDWYPLGVLHLDIPELQMNCNLPYEDRYLGLRLSNGSDHFFGWIRLDASSDSLLIKDFAYNSNPNGEIYAGQTETTGLIQANASDDVSIYTSQGKLFIKPENHAFSSYSLVSLAGRLIHSGTIKREGITLHKSVKPGCYLVRLNNANSFVVKKLVLK
jgi:hypothetical protein